jgi:hypothetical protein
MHDSSLIPPRARRADGSARQIGIELELSGLDLPELADAVARHFGAERVRLSEYEYRVSGSDRGTFRVELDFQYLKELGQAPLCGNGIVDEVLRLSEDALAEVVKQVVPMEIVTPPLPPEALPDVDRLVATLRALGGRGTRHSPVYAFGLHFNPDVPSLEADALLRYLRAFLCVYDWLVEVEDVDWSRRITPYVDPFPGAYVKRVLDPAYAPDMPRLIDDYLLHNPVRNRALDLLPLFAYLDRARVARWVQDPRVQPRPTFHYRLPNCDVDVPGWGVSGPWRRWLQVERLAEDPVRLDALCRRYLAYLDDTLERLTLSWAEISRPWLGHRHR